MMVTVDDLVTVGTTQAAVEAGISARQLDYWIRCGYVRAVGAGRGSGSRTLLSRRELQVLALTGRLARAGLALDVAAAAARVLSDEPEKPFYLGDGLALSVDEGMGGGADGL